MPLYEFKCTKCRQKIERVVYNDTSVICDKCGELMERQFSGKVYLRFKGDGFYTNDYQKKDKQQLH